MRRGMWGKSLGESARRRLFTSNLLFKSCRPKRRCQSNLSTVSILANRSLHQNMMYSGCRGTALPKVCLQAITIFFSPVPPSTEGLFTGYMFVYNLGQVKCFLLVGFRLVHVNVLAKKRKSPCIQAWTKLLRKLHTWWAFFLTFVADRFFPPPPPESSVVGSSKASRIPKRLLEVTLNWGRGFSLGKAVDLEIVLLR